MMWFIWFVLLACPLMACLGGAISGSLPADIRGRYAQSYYRWFRVSLYVNLCWGGLVLATCLWLPEYLMEQFQSRLYRLESQVIAQLRQHTAQAQAMQAAFEEMQARQPASPNARTRRR